MEPLEANTVAKPHLKLSDASESVLKVLEECQRAPLVAGGGKGFAAEIGRCAAANEDDFMSTVLGALDRALLVGKKESAVEKILHVFKMSCSVVSSSDKKKSSKNSNKKGGKRDSEDSVTSTRSTADGQDEGFKQCYIGNGNLQLILEHLLNRLVAQDKSVRLRSAQLIGEILKVIPGDGAFLSDSLWDGLEKGLTARLSDKAPAVRARAAAALERMQDPELCASGNDPICSALANLIASDSSAEVRRAALRSVVISKHTLTAIVARTHDSKEEVRECAFLQLGERVHLRSLSIAQRNQLLKDGLKDRAEAVRNAATKMLCNHWLSLVGNGDPLALLRHLDPEAFEDTALLALRAIFARENGAKNGSITNTERELLAKATSFDFSNEAGDVALSPEGSLYLFAKCEALVARGAEDEVEQLVTDMSALCAVASASLVKCTASFAAEDIVALRSNHFALEHLLRTAALLDSRHDIVGQQVATVLVKKVLSSRAVKGSEALAAAFGLLRGFYQKNSSSSGKSNKSYGCSASDEEDFIRQGADIVFDCLDPLENADGEPSDGPNEAELAERATREMAAESLALRIKECAAAEDYAGAAALKAELVALEEMPEEQVLDWRMERALLLTQALLAAVRRPVLVAEATSLFTRVVVPNLQSEAVDRRQCAVKCLALYCQLNVDQARQNLQVFIMIAETQEEEPQVRCDALKGIFDLILLWGMSALVDVAQGEDHMLQEQGEQIDEDALSDLRDDLMFKLLEFMDNQDKGLRLAAAEGFAKLAVVGRLVDARVLQCLVVLYFHPNSESDVRLRQCLAVCFPTLAENTTSGRSAIEDMVGPLIESLVQPEAGSPLEEISVNAVLQYLVFLLTFSKPQMHFVVAERIICELTVDPSNANARSLTRALCALKVESCSHALLALLNAYSAELEPMLVDGVTKRQFAKWEKMLQNCLGKRIHEPLEMEASLEEFQGQTVDERVHAFGEGVQERKAQVSEQLEAGAESAAVSKKAKSQPKARKLTKKREQWGSGEDSDSSSELSDELASDAGEESD